MENILKYPVVMYTLAPDDEGYDQGATCRLDDRQGDQFFFFNKDDTVRFIQLHGLIQINEPEMVEIRRALGLPE